MEESRAVSSSTLFLDRVGEVILTMNPDSLSWENVRHDSNASSCLGKILPSKTESRIKFSDAYAVEFIGWGLIHDFVSKCGGFFSGKNSEMYQFVVHGVHRNKTPHSPWTLSAYIFGHKDLQTCETWVEKLNACINREVRKPKNLLIIVHPLCGKGNGCKIWETVAPIFARAKVKTTVTVTQRAGHAYDMMRSYTDKELSAFDGVVVVGGDGLFNEVLNGLLSSRHKVPHPPAPPEFNPIVNDDQDQQSRQNKDTNGGTSFDDLSGTFSETSHKSDHEPLLSTSESSGLGISKFTNGQESYNTDQDAFSFPNDWFRLGIIPAGSTDAIVLSTTGFRNPVTSALQIILGEKVSLDIAQVVRWKTSPSSMDLPSLRYAASFAGYGFYGDVIKESEKCRWMGPKRYDYAGTKVFLEHRSYEAEIAFLEAKTVEQVSVTVATESGAHPSLLSPKNSDKVVCRKNCNVCNEARNMLADRRITSPNTCSEDSRWLRSKGRFLSVGAAIISCRNERAPEGLVADAHLADGFLHLILVKDCPRLLYLWHLIQLTRRGTNPLDFDFVEHHKTTAFTFVANHDGSAWNLDGELFQACKVSAQVCRGLINLFASGPEL